MDNRKQRQGLTPNLEPIEGRQLLSGIMVALQSNVHIDTPAEVVATAASHAHSTTSGHVSAQAGAGGTGAGGGGSGGSSGNNSGSQSGGAVVTGTNTTSIGGGLYGGGNNPQGIAFPTAPIIGAGTPTAAELAREKFHAVYNGPMRIQPGRFSDQSSIIFLRGLGGSTANFFLHSDYNLAIVRPSVATEPTTGFAFLDDKNNNSGGVFGLDLVADPTSVDAQGRPTRLTFTADPNVYGGIFFVDSAVGTVTITYHKNTATTVFDGRIYTSGITNPFENTDLYAKHSG